MSRDEATLLDIERSAQLIIEFTRGMDGEDFLDDVKTQSAVLPNYLFWGKRSSDCRRHFVHGIRVSRGP
jgi:uncharacterized protein with HEPN domain